MSERRVIFEYIPVGEYLSIVRETDGSVSLTVNGGLSTACLSIPAAQWRKLVAAFALEPDLWPGADPAYDAKRGIPSPMWAPTDAGKPHGDPLA